MTEKDALDAENHTPPLLSRVVPAQALRRAAAIERDVTATKEERAAIAAAFDLVALEALSFAATLSPEGREDWRLEGRLEARGAQACGVTLDPAPFEIDARAVRLWSPSVAARDPFEAATFDSRETPFDDGDDPDDGEELERLPEPVDLGVVALEAFALHLDPFPRAPGADFDSALAAPPGVEPLTDAAAKPFAALKALKTRANAEQDGESDADGD